MCPNCGHHVTAASSSSSGAQGFLGCLTGGTGAGILSVLAFISALQLIGSRSERITLTLSLDLVIVILAFASYLWWAPRSRYPTFLRAFALGLAIVGLGGVTMCTGVLSGS